MATLDQFASLVLPWVAGVADLALRSAVREACIEFCKRSLIVQVSVSVTTVANQAQYTLTPGAEQVVTKLLGARLDGTPLDVVRPEEVDVERLPFTGSPRAVWIASGSNVLELATQPGAGRALIARVATQPLQNATQVPDVLLQVHGNAIASGAVARLASMPKRAYTNMDVAGAQQTLFERHIAKAQTRAYYANARSRPAAPLMSF